MSDEKDELIDNLFFTEEGRLRHENQFLKERVANLEVFKKNFFAVQNNLIEANEKLSLLENQLNLDRLKKRIIELGEDAADSVVGKGGNEDILEFFHESITAANFQDLVMSMFQSVEGLGLDMAVQIRNKKDVLNYALDQSKKDACVVLINHHLNDGEIIERDGYIIINHKYLSLVAGELPANESVKNQQVKEYLEIIALGANTRIDTLSRKLELEDLRGNIYKIFQKTNRSFEMIQGSMDNQVMAISELFLGCEKHLKDSLSRMRISEEHMKILQMILNDAKSELNLLLTSSLTMDEHFISVMKKLEKAYAPDQHEQ